MKETTKDGNYSYKVKTIMRQLNSDESDVCRYQLC